MVRSSTIWSMVGRPSPVSPVSPVIFSRERALEEYPRFREKSLYLAVLRVYRPSLISSLKW